MFGCHTDSAELARSLRWLADTSRISGWLGLTVEPLPLELVNQGDVPSGILLEAEGAGALAIIPRFVDYAGRQGARATVE
jgi:hypothetical protein